MTNTGDARKFKVSIKLDIREMQDGAETPFCDVTANYHDLGYDGVILLEKEMAAVLDNLRRQGVKQAIAMGLGRRLADLGVDTCGCGDGASG